MSNEKPLALRRNLQNLKLELKTTKQRTWGSSIYGIGQEADGPKSDEGNYSEFNYTDEVLRCTSCDFEIEFSSVNVEETCPLCDKKLGKDAIRVSQNSSLQKRAWKSDKSGVLSGDSVVIGKKLGKGCSSYASDISNANGSTSKAPLHTGEEKRV